MHIFENNDLLLLTETWTDEYSDISFPGFKVFWLSRLEKNRNSKRSSGGIAIYVRDKFYKTNMLFKQDSDDILWLRFEGCLFNLQYDVFMCLCYIVPADSSREAYIEINVLDRISDHILQIANETNNQYHLLICGDFNGRTGTEPDYVIFDTDVNVPVLPDDYETDIELQRFSQDNIVNHSGRKALEFCKSRSLRICNGRYGEDKGVGKFTFIGANGRSVVDYVIMSQALAKNIVRFYVDDPSILSDHCTVHFSLTCILSRQNDSQIHSENCVNERYIWNSEKSEDCASCLNSHEEGVVNLQNQLHDAMSGADIDDNLTGFITLVDNICDPLFARQSNTCNTSFK